MGKTITLTDPEITDVLIDIVRKKVTVKWVIKTDRNQPYQRGSFVFWDTMPTVDDVPETWQTLNTSAKSALTTIVNMANNFIAAQDL